MRLRTAALLAAALTLGCGDDGITLPDERAATAIEVAAGDDQNGRVGAALAEPVSVLVTDAEDRPVVSQQVEFTVSGGGEVSPASAVTNAQGVAATQWVLGPQAGTQTLTARPVGNGAASVSASAQATATAAPPAALVYVSGSPQTGVAGTALADSLIVRVTDEFGNPVSGAEVTWTAAGGGGVSAAATTTGADGRTGVIRTLGTTPGAQSTTASMPDVTGSPVTFDATATVGSAGQLTITTQPSSSAQSGVAFPRQPAVQLRDAANNPVPQSGVAIQAELASGPGGSLGGVTLAATNGSGLATFSNLSISGPAGQYTINFRGANSSLTGVTSATVTIAAGAPTALRFAVQPASTGAGQTLSPAVRVELIDAQGNVVTDASRTVSLSLLNAGGASLSGTTSVTTSSGVAVFSNLAVDAAGSGYQLRATASGVSAATSEAFSISAGSATQLVFTTQPTATAAGAPISPAVVVVARDAQGNLVTSYSGQVTMSLAANPAGGTLGGTTTVAASGGVATFSNLTLDRAGTGYRLRASSGSLSDATSGTFSVTAGGAATLEKVAGDDQTAAAGATLPTDPAVRVLDAAGNPVSGVGVTFTVTGGGGSISGASQTTDGTGRAAVGSWTLGTTAGTNTLSASAAGLTVTFTATGTAASAARLVFVTPPPGSVASGAQLTPAPVVQLVDANNNPVSVADVPVTLTIAPTGASLSGTTTRSTDAQGRATFSGVSVSGTAGSYTLSFSGQGSPLTAPLTVTAGAVSQALSGVSADPAAITAAGTSTVTVTARDAAGNPVAGVSVALSSPDLSFGTTSLTTDAAGQASTSVTGTTTGTHPITAVIDGTVQVQTTLDVQAASTATGIELRGPNPSQTGEAVTFGWTVGSGAGTPDGTVVVAASTGESCSGDAPAGECSLTFATAGSRDVTASYGGSSAFAPSVSGALEQTVEQPAPSSGASIEVRRQPSAQARSGERFTSQPEIRVRDADGSNMSGVPVSAELVGTGGELGGRLTDVTRPNGVGSWDDLRITGVGTFTLRFRAAGTAALSSPIVVTQ